MLVVVLSQQSVFGQLLVWDGAQDKVSIGNRVELLEDATGTLSYEQVVSQDFDSKFSLSQSINLNLGYTDSFYWLRFTIDNQTSDEVMLELAQAGLPVVELYYRTNKGIVHRHVAGYELAMEDKIIKSSYQVFALPAGKSVCYLKVNTNSEPIPLNLYQPKAFELASNRQKLAYGIYLGLMFFVVLNSLFLFISLRKRLYLFYSLIVFIYICYSAIVIDGFIVYWIPNLDLKLLYTSIPAIGITLQTIYCLVFLEVKKYSIITFKVIRGFIVYFGIWMIAKFFFTFPVVQPINTIHALISFGIMGFVGLKVSQKGNRLGRLFALAYFIYFILVAIQALYINTGDPHYIGGLSYVAYATLIEVLLLSFLLSRRFEWEKREIEKEKLEAQYKVVQKTLENERIVEEQRKMLEKQVEARTEQLQEKNDRLIDLNKEKDGIVHVIAHDLKSPLCTIIGYTELIKHDAQLSANQIEYLSIMDKVLSEGVSLIDEVLDVHAYGVSTLVESREEIHVESFMLGWLKTFEQELKRKEQEIILKIDVQNPKMLSNRIQLSRILNNLLTNSIKFSERQTQIIVSVTELENTLDFSVKDFGPGISVEDQRKMFKQFQKLSAKPTDGESSSGLGLAITKKLTEQLNGKIKVKSKLGIGTEIIIKLSK